MIGILAYGSLIANPGDEIQASTQHVIHDIDTPFEVEYARSSTGRAGAPTLVLVPNGKGGRVRSCIFVLKENITLETAQDMLYRREINRVGGSQTYPKPKAEAKNAIFIRQLPSDGDCTPILYTDISYSQKTKIAEIYSDTATTQEKAGRLASRAVET
jgi:cation transport regulator ChaC